MIKPSLFPTGESYRSRVHNYHKRQWEGEYGPSPDTQQSISLLFHPRKLTIISLIFTFCLLILLGRLFYLQIIQGNHWSQLAEGNRIKTEIIKANRGIIYDQQGQILVKNIPNFSLQIIPAKLSEQQEEEILSIIGKIINLSPLQIRDKITEQQISVYYPTILKENLTYQEFLLLKIKTANYPGVLLKTDFVREYLTPQAHLSHLLGYVGRVTEKDLINTKYSLNDYIGKSGLELFDQDILAGQDGKKQIEIDSQGRAKKFLGAESAIDGQDLVLTIDLDLQQKLAQTLISQIRSIGARRGSAVAVNPQNGQILAMVSYPDFDNNLFSQGISQQQLSKLVNSSDYPFIFRPISGEYPPGSIFKIVLASAGLQEGIITSKTNINSVGGINIDQKWWYPDWKVGGHGLTNVIKALAESVNTFFYYIGGGYKDFSGLGLDLINHYAREFGLGKKLGIDIYGETDGFLPTRQWRKKTTGEQWYIGDTYHLSIGQGDILVTPLQIAMLTATIANNGKLFQPYLIKEIINSLGKSKEIKPVIIKQNVIDEKYLKVVQQGLRAAVTQGSARSLSGLPIDVAGKTGTAQVANKKSHAWFTCYAPYDQPTIALTILIENSGEGSAVSAPVARDVLQWYFTRER